ncbi:chemotaxis protein CheC [Desulfonema magnum]|uniref:Chemotaxis protein CheC domain-containing protein n=1 Tax=Desulfonema magnum TaxID=45655 RepID=A0A975BLR6_9BACT|nr:chemotaxis protein CheC [Desulfonema magnum]QTA88039.1 Chemotaxis protein CheC domain-containing protein [Desulfonema magnum]
MYDDNLDIVREVINIGIGEAADALSRLVNTRVIIKTPDICIMNAADVHDYIRKEMTSLSVYISQNFKEMIKGKTILFYTKECAVSLLNAICGQTMKTSSLTESGIATLNEIGNNIMVTCMSEISNQIDARIWFDLPEVTVEISENYFQNLLNDLKELDKAIVIKSEMRIKEKDIQGYLFILLSFEDFNLLIQGLWKKINTASS